MLGVSASCTLLAQPASAQRPASNGRNLLVCNSTGVVYTTYQKVRVVSAPNLGSAGPSACTLVQFAPPPAGPGTYYGKVTWTNDTADFARFPMELMEVLTISPNGRCSAKHSATINTPGGVTSFFETNSCQFGSFDKVFYHK